jgi:hypothetical protein
MKVNARLVRQERRPPSYYNQQGRDTPATALNDIYGAGSVAFFKLLGEWRAQDGLEGMEITRKERSRSDLLATVDGHNAD